MSLDGGITRHKMANKTEISRLLTPGLVLFLLILYFIYTIQPDSSIHYAKQQNEHEHYTNYLSKLHTKPESVILTENQVNNISIFSSDGKTVQTRSTEQDEHVNTTNAPIRPPIRPLSTIAALTEKLGDTTNIIGLDEKLIQKYRIEQEDHGNTIDTQTRPPIRPLSTIVALTEKFGNNTSIFSSNEKAMLSKHGTEQDKHRKTTNTQTQPPIRPSPTIVALTEKFGNNTSIFSSNEKAIESKYTIKQSKNDNTTWSQPSTTITLTQKFGNRTSNFSSNEKTISKPFLETQTVRIEPKQTIDSENVNNRANRMLTSDLYEGGHYIPNKKLCPKLGSSLKFLILIMSAPNNNAARLAIRQTWGHFAQRKDVRMSFVLGQAKQPGLTSKIRHESRSYRDIIGCEFMDSYNNLTLKAICMMEWIDNYCPKVKFILKTDDDMFINIPRLISFVNQRSKYKRTIFGRLAKGWPPFRNKSSKWFISTQQYTPTVFPDFTTGPAYLLTGDIVHDLYITALNTTFFKLEDVFMTGVVAQAIKAKRVNAKEFLNKEVEYSTCNVKMYISLHGVKYYEQFDLWKILNDDRQKCIRKCYWVTAKNIEPSPSMKQ